MEYLMGRPTFAPALFLLAGLLASPTSPVHAETGWASSGPGPAYAPDFPPAASPEAAALMHFNMRAYGYYRGFQAREPWVGIGRANHCVDGAPFYDNQPDHINAQGNARAWCYAVREKHGNPNGRYAAVYPVRKRAG